MVGFRRLVVIDDGHHDGHVFGTHFKHIDFDDVVELREVNLEPAILLLVSEERCQGVAPEYVTRQVRRPDLVDQTCNRMIIHHCSSTIFAHQSLAVSGKNLGIYSGSESS